jgi:serine/threonine protein kinase
MPAARLHAGTIVNRYEILRCIGQGAMGVVYEAVHRSLGRRVALKVLHTHPADTADSRYAAERFVREGRAAAQVRHPHVVDVYDFGVHDGLPFLVMELVEGESLAELLRRATKLPVERAVETLLPVLSAVAELHAAGIVHRDIKPANILLARGGDCPKLADFGVSRFDDGSPSITRSGTVIGTPEYMPPELLRANGPATERSDQYALGVTLYECVTGERPFRGATDYELMHAVVSAAVLLPSRHEPSVPSAFDEVVLRAMHRDAERRFGSVDELAESLLPFASDSVRARWRPEFVPSRVRLQWEAGASARRSLRDMRVRRPFRFVASLGVVSGLAALAFVAGTARHERARHGESRPTAPTAAPSSATSNASAERTIVPAVAPPAGASPAGSAALHLQRQPRTWRAKQSTSASAIPSIAASSAVRGDNEAPILDVP